MKVYLDDIRQEPEGWTRTYTALETISLLDQGGVEELSLDHDLGLEHYGKTEYTGGPAYDGTGMDVVKFLELKSVVDPEWHFPKKVRLHTANPAGRERMIAGLKTINNRLGNIIQIEVI